MKRKFTTTQSWLTTLFGGKTQKTDAAKTFQQTLISHSQLWQQRRQAAVHDAPTYQSVTALIH